MGNQNLVQDEEVLEKSKEEAVDKSSVDYNVHSPSFFLDGYEELKERFMKHYLNIASEVKKWEGDDAKAKTLTDE